MEIDEVSVVDKGAAADALIAIAKRATQEVDMPSYTYEDGTPVSEDQLQEGDIVFDGEGNAFQYVLEDEVVEDDGVEDEQLADEQVLETVGKSAFGSFTDEIRDEISKAFSGTGEDKEAVKELFSKAAAEIDSLRQRASAAEEIAKAERDLRLTEAYISKAASYNLPGDPGELGPVLYRMAESMSYEDCAVINKCLTAAGATIFQEIGAVGGGDNEDILTQVSKAAAEGGVDPSDIFDSNPDAYAAYLADQRH
jgi:hypothetical protein